MFLLNICQAVIRNYWSSIFIGQMLFSMLSQSHKSTEGSWDNGNRQFHAILTVVIGQTFSTGDKMFN